MKKAKFIVLVLSVILAFAMFAVACDDDVSTSPETYTVTFVNDGTTVKEAEVEKGKALTADNMPEDPTTGVDKVFDGWFSGETEVKVGYVPTGDVTATATFTQLKKVEFKVGDDVVKTVYVRPGAALTAEDLPEAPAVDADEAFDGWFSGETEITVGYKPTADVTASATVVQLKKVEFKVGDNIVKTVYVRPGAAISEDQLPEEPDMGGYSFSGWYNGDEFFDTDENTVSADMTLVANFVKTSYIIKFEADGEVIDTKYIAIGPDAKFEVTDIPSAPASEEGEVFLGWYNGGVKAVSGGAVTADGTYVATFVSEASYTGVWYNDEEKIMVYFENGKVNLMGKNEKTYTYAAAGSISFSEGMLTSKESFTMLVTGDVMQLTYGHYNDYEEPVTDEYVLYKAAPVDYAGVYNKDKTTTIEVSDGGFLTSFNGSKYYARMYAEGDAYKIEFKSYSYSDMITADAVIDAKGNIVVTGDSSVINGYKGVFVKGVSAVSSYSGSNYYFYDYTLEDDSHLYVLNNNFTEFDYAEVEGTIATDNIVTLHAFDSELIFKFISSYQFELAAEERGEYTLSGGSDKITLDGFGSATVGGATKAYYMLGTTAVFDNGEGGAAKLDLTGKTYEKAVRDGKQGTFNAADGLGGYDTVILDGFGGLVQEGYSTDYGTYEFDGDKVTFVGVEDGVYTVMADGNVFVDDEDEFHAFVKEGYVVDSQLNSFVGDNEGWWVNDADPADYLFIDTNAEKVTYKGKSYSYKATWDGSKLLVSSWFDEFVFSINEGKVNVTYVVEESPVTDVYTSAPEPVIEQDEYVGVWTADGNSFWFDGYGTVVVNEDAVKYTRQPDNSVKFDYGSLTLTALLTDGTMSISWDDGEGNNGTYDDTAPAELDAFAGVWNPPAEVEDKYILTFSGAGVVHVYNVDYVDEYVSYEVAENVATFYSYYEDWKCTMDGDSMVVVSYDGTVNNVTYTKEAEAQLDAFAGTWTGTLGPNSCTIICDGLGNININGSDYTYTPGTDTIKAGYFTVTMKDADTMHVSYADDDYNEFEADLTKSA